MRERVRTARVARLATIDPDGRPHLVPIVFALDGERLYSAVDAKPKRSRRLRRVANARERPDVTVLVDHYEDDLGPALVGEPPGTGAGARYGRGGRAGPPAARR